MPDKRERVFTEQLDLPGGRRARVSAYDDGSVRFELSDAPYVIQEAFLGGRGDHAVLMLSPGKQGSAAMHGKVQPPPTPTA